MQPQDKHKAKDDSSEPSETAQQPDDEATKADPLERCEPQPKEPQPKKEGDRLEDYTG